jgi:PilZ domain-containing protein
MAVIGDYRTHAELRKKPRRPFRYSARIVTAKDKPLVSCWIADISEGGARLVLACEDDDLPQIFTLLLTPKGDTRRFCQIIRRDGATLGVRFIEAL